MFFLFSHIWFELNTPFELGYNPLLGSIYIYISHRCFITQLPRLQETDSQVAKAWEVLGDDQQRAAYDADRAADRADRAAGAAREEPGAGGSLHRAPVFAGERWNMYVYVIVFTHIIYIYNMCTCIHTYIYARTYIDVYI